MQLNSYNSINTSFLNDFTSKKINSAKNDISDSINDKVDKDLKELKDSVDTIDIELRTPLKGGDTITIKEDLTGKNFFVFEFRVWGAYATALMPIKDYSRDGVSPESGSNDSFVTSAIPVAFFFKDKGYPTLAVFDIAYNATLKQLSLLHSFYRNVSINGSVIERDKTGRYGIHSIKAIN